MIHNHSSGKCRLLKRFFVICMVLLLICSVSPNLITAEADMETRESVSEDFAEENQNTESQMISDEKKTDENEADRQVLSEGNKLEAGTDETVSDEIPTDETASDETVSDETVSDGTVSDGDILQPEEDTETDLEIAEDDENEIEIKEESEAAAGQAVESEKELELITDSTDTVSKVQLTESIQKDGCLHISVLSTDGTDLTCEQLIRDGYTITWSRDGAEVERVCVTGERYNLAEDYSWLNVALDAGARKTYKVKIEKNGQTVESNGITIPYYDALQNGSFETPVCTTSYQPFINSGQQGIVWKTTASDKKIELISASTTKKDNERTHQSLSEEWHGMSAAAAGTQFAELNANEESSLYQDVLTAPGSTMHWRIAHAARLRNGSAAYSGTDSMYVVIMDAEKAETLSQDQQKLLYVAQMLANGNTVIDGEDYTGAGSFYCEESSGKWTTHTGTYKVPEGQYLTRYFFVSASSASGDKTKSIGNHIDNVWFSTELPPPDPEIRADVVIKKEVAGPMGDVQKDFSFSYNYVNASGQVEEGTFSLKDFDTSGDSFTLSEIPAGSELTVTETDASGYTTTASYGGQAVNNVTEENETGRKIIKVVTGETDQELTVTNFKDVVPDTGIEEGSLRMEIFSISLVSAAMVMVIFRRKRKC